jgi:hypothetical protein
MIFPISFSIPACKIIDKVPEKTKEVATVIPGNTSTYIFKEESDYYSDYQSSIFAHTKKKAGWDCLRHYEILANGCMPIFENLKDCPPQTMVHFPKEIVIKQDPADITLLLEYTRKHLTTKAMAQYILDKIGKTPKNILFLSGQTQPDYLRCLTLHGFKELFGIDCHDYPRIPHLYTDFPNPKLIYGRGMTYTCLLNPNMRNPENDQTIEQDIINKKYDLIVYGSSHRGLPFIDIASNVMSKDTIVFLCGEDEHPNCQLKTLGTEGYNVFIREL